MSFLNPFFLIAIIAAGIPLMIHLLNLRRPTRVKFSTLTFFNELQRSTIRRIRIKRLLLLIMRMLAVACLAMVLARPFLPPGMTFGGSSQSPSLNAILIDNSISMNRVGENGPMIDYARDVAAKISEASRERDRFVLQVTNGEGTFPAILNHQNLNAGLEEVEATAGGNYLLERLTGLQDFMEETPYQVKKLFILTDGQQSQLQDLAAAEEMDERITIIDVGDVEVQNTLIAEVSVSSQMIGSGLPVSLNVRVRNEGKVPAINQFLSLEYDEQPLGQYSLSLQPGEERVFDFEVVPETGNSSRGRIWIEGDEFIEDNEYYFAIDIPEQRNILWLRPEQPAQTDGLSYTQLMLEASSDNDAQFTYDEVRPDQWSAADMSNYDAYILDGVEEIPAFMITELQSEVQSGKGLMFFPSENGSIENYNELLSRFNAGRWIGISGDYASFNSVASADELLQEHPSFQGLFETAEDEDLRFAPPSIYYYYRLDTGGSSNAFDLLRLNNGDPLVHEKRFGEGTLILSAIGNDPGWSNFPVQELFAPFYYRLTLYAAASEEGGLSVHTLGAAFSGSGNFDTEQVVLEVEGEEIRPEIDLSGKSVEVAYEGEEWKPGYLLITDGETQLSVGLNLPAAESELKESSEEFLSEQLNDIELSYVDAGGLNEQELLSTIQSTGFGREIWQWFLMAGMLFLVAESLISSFYKAEN